MVSIFKTLGEAITKKPWAFIALWLVILVISLPLVGVFTANIQYDTQKFIPKDLGAPSSPRISTTSSSRASTRTRSWSWSSPTTRPRPCASSTIWTKG